MEELFPETNQAPIRNPDSFAGKLCLYWIRLRCAWVLPALILTIVLLTFFIQSSRSIEEPNPQSYTPISILKSVTPLDQQMNYQPFITYNSNKLTIVGQESSDLHRKIFNFTQLDSNEYSTLTSLEIRHVLIDPEAMGNFLLKFKESIESIKLDQVWLYDFNFTQNKLPRIKSFHLNAYRNHKTDYYKNPNVLKSIFFFLPSENLTTNFLSYSKNFSKLHFSLDGTTVIDINTNNHDIVLNLPYCDELFQTIDKSTESLSLSWCNNFQAESLQKFPSLKRLNLNTVSSLKNIIALKSLPLEELIIFQNIKDKTNPKNISLDLKNLSTNIKKLAFGNVYLKYNANITKFPNVTELSIENVNLDLEEIRQIFPNSVTLYISTTNSNQSKISFDKIEQTFTQASSSNLSKVKLIFIQSESENMIMDLTNNNTSGRASVRSMTSYEVNYFRYKYLGFYDIDTYEDYVIWDTI